MLVNGGLATKEEAPKDLPLARSHSSCTMFSMRNCHNHIRGTQKDDRERERQGRNIFAISHPTMSLGAVLLSIDNESQSLLWPNGSIKCRYAENNKGLIEVNADWRGNYRHMWVVGMKAVEVSNNGIVDGGLTRLFHHFLGSTRKSNFANGIFCGNTFIFVFAHMYLPV